MKKTVALVYQCDGVLLDEQARLLRFAWPIVGFASKSPISDRTLPVIATSKGAAAQRLIHLHCAMAWTRLDRLPWLTGQKFSLQVVKTMV